MKQKINEFLKTERENYLDFINSLGEIDILGAIENSGREYTDKWYPKKYFENKTYHGPVYEADFSSFSYGFLKIYNKNPIVKIITDTIDGLNPPDEHLKFRLKRLRIALFLSVGSPMSPFFNIEAYKKCMEEMYIAMEKLVNHLKDKSEIIMVGYDSVFFIKPQLDKLGKVATDTLNQIVNPAKVKIRTYRRITKFYNNILHTFEDGGQIIKHTTKTGKSAEELKESILIHLDKGDTEKALALINNNNILRKEKLNEYKKVIEKNFVLR